MWSVSQLVPIDLVSHHASHRKLETVVLTSFASFSSTSTSSINIKATANIHSWFRRKDLERFSVQAESCLEIFAQFSIDPLSVLLPFFAFCPDGPFAVGMPGVHDLVHLAVWKWNQWYGQQDTASIYTWIYTWILTWIYVSIIQPSFWWGYNRWFH